MNFNKISLACLVLSGSASSPTSLTLSGSGAAPGFAISSTEGSASGAMTYGSCIFTVAQSTFAPAHPLAQGKLVTVNPCSLTVATAGLKGDGVAASASVTFVLGTASSTPVTVPVSISAVPALSGDFF